MSWDLDHFTRVDTYLDGALGLSDTVLDQALADSDAAGLPQIAVTPTQGRLLKILAETMGARRILEIGTLGGYSTIWMGRALPADGRLVTLEYAPRHAEVARKNIERAGLTDRVEVQVGGALELLPHLEGPFDLAFIDADKPSNPDYFDWALKLSRPGSLIVVDNVVRSGAVAERGDASVEGTRRMFGMIAAEPRVEATAVQTVGAKGWDGFCLIRVLS
jgi:predicted O-methyltransferase YrrM